MEPKSLSAEQFLLTTLIVKLAVMAVLATMLARYHRFRHILIFERRGWLDRLTFILAIGIPLMAGVAFRLLLNYNGSALFSDTDEKGQPVIDSRTGKPTKAIGRLLSKPLS